MPLEVIEPALGIEPDDDIFGAMGLRRELFLSGLRLAAGEEA